MEFNFDVKLVIWVEWIEGRWYINVFEGVYEKDLLMLIIFSKFVDVFVELLVNFRKSYVCLVFLLILNGYEIDNNFFGIDCLE